MSSHPAPYAAPLPSLGGNPSTGALGTSPGSFANPPRIAPGPDGKWTFSSPDTPGMPLPSEKTAWDFLPEGWTTSVEDSGFGIQDSGGETGERGAEFSSVTIRQADGPAWGT